MEAITTWVKNIVLVVIFACFLDLLLPNNSMQRFVKVIVGLFIMLAILNPLVGLLHNNWEVEAALASSAMTGEKQMGEINTAVSNAVSAREILTQEMYVKDLSKQIRTLVLSIQGVQEVKVAIELVDDKRQKNKGGINKIKIYVKPGSFSQSANVIEKITPVSVETEKETMKKEYKNELGPELTNKIKSTVAELYFISQEQIEVYKIF